MLLTGVQGGGKSYAVLRVAQKIMTDSDRLPVIVPLSRWAAGNASIARFLTEFLHDEFNLSRATQQALFARARIVPIFDGLDEIPDLHRRAETLDEFLRALDEWRPVAGDTRYIVSIRDGAWQDVPPDIRDRVDADVFSILEIDSDTASAFLSDSVRLAAPSDAGQRLMIALQAERLYVQVNRASRLSMLGVLLARYARPSEDPAQAIVSIAAAVRESRLPEVYLTTLLSRNGTRRARLLDALAVSGLSAYARYLRDNGAGRLIAGRELNARNITLHRVWPISGRSARVTDVILALALSAPGLAWLAVFLSRFAVVGWLVWASFVLIWMAMLIRTAWKPWVRAAVPDFSRLSQPSFFGRQAAASVGAGVVTTLFAPAWAALAVAVTAWLLIGLSVGFGQTLTTDAQVGVVGPAGVLARERHVSLLAGLAAFPGVTMAFSSTFGLLWGILLAAIYCLFVGATVASALWRRYLALCLVRARDLLTPAGIMRRALRLNLVREGGLTYQFREDELAAYIATLPRSWAWAWRASRAGKSATPRLPIE